MSDYQKRKERESRKRQNLESYPNWNVRLVGQTGSEVNKLRGELYTEAFSRIKRGILQNRPFEVIALCDAIIVDRLGAILQTIRHDEWMMWKSMAIGPSIKALEDEIVERNLNLGENFIGLLSETQQWAIDRNRALHGFVTVTPDNENKGVVDRLDDITTTALTGSSLVDDISNESRKVIRALKKAS